MGDELTTANAPFESPFCGSLRSKKFFMLDRLATSADEYLDSANHVWCCETQEVIGPDNRCVNHRRHKRHKRHKKKFWVGLVARFECCSLL
jgi:hypothetical protein